MFCSKCGKEIKPDTRFCAYCGAEITSGKIDHIPIRSEKKKGLWKVGMAGIVLVSGICLLVVLGLYAGKRSESESLENEIKTETPSMSNGMDMETDEQKEDVYQIKSAVSYNNKGEETSRVEYTYNEDGSISDSVRQYANGIIQTLHYEYEYNEKGIVVKENRYDENGRLQSEYFFDEEGVKTGYEIYGYDEDGNLSYEGEYDGEGNQKKSVNYFGEGWRSLEEYYMDEHGKVIKKDKITYDDKNEIISNYTELYDESGNLYGWINNMGSFQHSSEAYDSNGNRMGQINYLEDGTVEILPEEGYEAAGDHFVKAGELKDTKTDHKKDVYDDAGNVIKSFYYNAADELIYRTEYEYQKIE